MSWLDDLETRRMTAKKNFDISVLNTGYKEFNEALGVGGIPIGKIIDIAGHVDVGKTSLTLDIIKEAINSELSTVLLDLDNSFDAQYAIGRGVKTAELLVFRPDSSRPQDLLVALESLINDGLIKVLVIDSISSFGGNISTVLEGLTKLITNKDITVVLTSQIRHNYEDARDYKTPYMKVINRYANIRVMLRKITSIRHEHIIIGRKVTVDIYKNSVANPKSTETEIYF
jgi:recombination protein RecA